MRSLILFFSAGLLAACEGADISAAKQLVRKKLIDPSSAKFESVGMCPASSMMHGQVNSKNRFGAYSGSVAFYVSNGEVYIFDGVPISDSEELRLLRFSDALAKNCFLGEGVNNIRDFANAYDASNDSIEKFISEKQAELNESR